MNWQRAVRSLDSLSTEWESAAAAAAAQQRDDWPLLAV